MTNNADGMFMKETWPRLVRYGNEMKYAWNCRNSISSHPKIQHGRILYPHSHKADVTSFQACNFRGHSLVSEAHSI